MANNKTIKARYFTFIIYPESIPANWEECLEKLGVSMAVSPLHNLDETDRDFENMNEEEKALIRSGKKVYKKAHYHVIYIARNPVTIESVRNKIKRVLGNQSVSHIEIVDSVENIFLYLTHESSDAIKKNKHKYDKADLKFINDFDIDRYVSLDEIQKRELKNLLLNIIRKNHLVNVVHLLNFIDLKGSEYGISNLNDVNEVITSNASGFRLFFDANYQMGYRYNFIDIETGEIVDEKNG